MGIFRCIDNKGSRGLVIIVVLIVFVIILGAFIYAAGQKPTISLNGGQWDSIRLNNAIAGFIIEKGYGYPVVVQDSMQYTYETGMTDGTIDLNMEIWPQNKMGWYDEQIARGTIADLGPTFSSGPQFFMIPRWMAEQYHIQTISI